MNAPSRVRFCFASAINIAVLLLLLSGGLPWGIRGTAQPPLPNLNATQIRNDSGPSRIDANQTVPPSLTLMEGAGTRVAVAVQGTLTTVATVPVGSSPEGVAYDPANGYVYVANSGGSTVSVINGASVAATVTVGDHPLFAMYDRQNGYVYVVNYGSVPYFGTVTVLNGTSVIGTVIVGQFPVHAAYDSRNGFVYVVNWGSNNVSILNGTSVVATANVGLGPKSATYDDGNGYVYVTNYGSCTSCPGSSVSVLNGTSVLATVNVGTRPFDAVYDVANGNVYVTNVGSDNISILNGTSVVKTVDVGSHPFDLTYDSGNHYVYVANTGSGNVSVLDGLKVRAWVNTGSGAADPMYDSGSGFVYVSNGYENSVSALNGTSVVKTVIVGAGPGESAFDSNNGWVYVTVSASNSVSVIASAFTVSFGETGLPRGTSWGVSLGPFSNTSTTNTVRVAAPVGAYQYRVSPVPGYTTAWTGNATVSQGNVSVNVTFFRVYYTLSFVEWGLANGTQWSVTLQNTTHRSGINAITFVVPNGTYGYQIVPIPGFVTNRWGQATVGGNDTRVDVVFFLNTYTITFTETGLPWATRWVVHVGSSINSSTTNMLTFDEPNGSYVYRVTSIPGYSTNWSGSVTVNANVARVYLSFSRVTYSVAFLAAGVPGGKSWGVSIGASTFTSSTNQLTIAEPNGTYIYSILRMDGYTTDSPGSFTVNGVGVALGVTFARVTYSVTFTEMGLPAGASWSVVIEGRTVNSTGSSISIPEPNGTFSYSILPIQGFTTPGRGNVTVRGSSPSTVDLLFSPLPRNPLFLGVPVAEAYVIVGGFVAVAVVGVILTVQSTLRRKAERKKELPPGVNRP